MVIVFLTFFVQTLADLFSQAATIGLTSILFSKDALTTSKQITPFAACFYFFATSKKCIKRATSYFIYFIKGQLTPFLNYPPGYVPHYPFIIWVPVLELYVAFYLNYLTKINIKSCGGPGKYQS